jgi:hypothetical protein
MLRSLLCCLSAWCEQQRAHTSAAVSSSLQRSAKPKKIDYSSEENGGDDSEYDSEYWEYDSEEDN